MKQTQHEIQKVSDIVLEPLKKEERCRNDDKWLTFQVLSRYTKIFIPFEDFEKIPAFETIKRVRAKIQNVDGLYTPTDPKVLKKRQNREAVFKHWSVE